MKGHPAFILSPTGRSLAARRAAALAAWAIAALGVAWLAEPALGQFVTVQQVEAFENPPTNTHYAPVNFNGSATATSPVNFPGITFRAQANTTDTLSSQAFSVGQQFYGIGTVGQPFINNVYNNSADNFINGLNVQGTLGAGQSLPNGFGNGIRVSNHSYVADFGNATVDENGIRRIDYLVNSQDVVFVASAVSGGAFANQNLVWSARNSLAVRGDSASTPFDPSAGGGNSITSGKRRADVWSDGSASVASGRVSGHSAALIGQATALGLTDATHNQVVRSLVMTGADPTAVGATTGTWTRNTANNLNTTLGAGRANYTESLSILQGGERTLQIVTGSTTPNVSSNSLKGFAYGTSTTGQQAIVINAPNGIGQLSATLNWNVTQQVTGSLIDTSNAGQIFPDLKLELRTATLSGGQFLLGSSALPQAGLSSNAVQDNVEHLYFSALTDGGNLPAGTYAFLITGDPSLTTTIGFAYDIIAPVPEPSALILAGGGLLALLCGRRLSGLRAWRVRR